MLMAARDAGAAMYHTETPSHGRPKHVIGVTRVKAWLVMLLFLVCTTAAAAAEADGEHARASVVRRVSITGDD